MVKVQVCCVGEAIADSSLLPSMLCSWRELAVEEGLGRQLEDRPLVEEGERDGAMLELPELSSLLETDF